MKTIQAALRLYYWALSSSIEGREFWRTRHH